MGRFRNRHYTGMESSRMKIIAFYTPNYLPIVEELEKSIQRFGYDYEIVEVEDRGTWEENCGQKPEIIYDALKRHEENLLYLDADAVIVRELPLEELESDEMMVYVMRWTSPQTGWINELISGCIYLPYNETTLDVVKKWVRHQQANPMIWDQQTLGEVLNKLPNYKFKQLSPEWNWIEKYHKSLNLNPIIVQNQISRVMKNDNSNK